MTEKWDKKALVDYIPSLLEDFEGDEVFVTFYHSSRGNLDIEIEPVRE